MSKLILFVLFACLFGSYLCNGKESTEELSREKRFGVRPGDNFYINILVVVDPELRRWVESTYAKDMRILETFYEHIIVGINARLLSLSNLGIRIFARGVQLYIPDNVRVSCICTDYDNIPIPRPTHRFGKSRLKICKFEYLRKFKKWIAGPRFKDIFRGRTIDHAILLTRYDLIDSDGDGRLKGWSTLGDICNLDSASVVEMTFDLQMIQTATYTLGRSLGALDATPDRQMCPLSAGYVMSPKPFTFPLTRAHWKFTPCNMREIKLHFARLPTACMSKMKQYPDVKLSAVKRYTAKEQCKLAAFGYDSHSCFHGSCVHMVYE